MQELFQLAPSFSSPYRFFEIQSGTACKFVLNQISNTGWSLYRSTDPDPFAANLPALQKGTYYDLAADELVYLRFPNKGSATSLEG